MASGLVAPLVMAPVGWGWASGKRLRSADAPAFGDARATRRADGRAKRGITRESRAKENAPLVSIGSRTSGTVRTRHADYVSRGVCFSRERLSADPGIKNLPSLETDARGAGCASSEPGARGRARWIDDRSKTETESRARPPKGRTAWSCALGMDVVRSGHGASSSHASSRPRTKMRARLVLVVSDRPPRRKNSADEGRRRRPALTPARADLDPVVESHPNARVAL